MFQSPRSGFRVPPGIPSPSSHATRTHTYTHTPPTFLSWSSCPLPQYRPLPAPHGPKVTSCLTVRSLRGHDPQSLSMDSVQRCPAHFPLLGGHLEHGYDIRQPCKGPLTGCPAFWHYNCLQVCWAHILAIPGHMWPMAVDWTHRC